MDTKNINEQINSVVNNLAEKLGVAVEYIFEILIKQARIDACVKILYFLICLILLVIGCRVAWHCYKQIRNIDINKISDETAGYLAALVAIGVLLILPGIFGGIEQLSNILTGFVNPEYKAIEMILDQIR